MAPLRPIEDTGVAISPVFPALEFDQPVLLLQEPGGGARFFVVERTGTVKVFPNRPGVTATDVRTFIKLPVDTSAREGGLLGMAFHPRFASNGEVFLSYTDSGGPTGLRSVISRFKSMDGGATLSPASEQVVLTQPQPFENHNGGNIAFGPDGFLYIGFGDGGSAGDPRENAQNLGSLLGKMLRIDVDGASPYAIPPTNPFRAGGGRPEIYAWGFRNPWRWSFDRATGELWVGDVGQRMREEVDKVVLGGNYGWNIMEGSTCYEALTCRQMGLIGPVVEYGREEGISITGGFVYRGSAIPSLIGRFVYGDFGSGRIWAVTLDPQTGKSRAEVLLDSNLDISSFAEGADGELYVLDFRKGTLHELVPAGTREPVAFPQRLSESGCVDPADPTRLAPGVIPYTLNAPLWSDGAEKRRAMAIPDGTTVRVAADGDFEFPVGSVLVKEFFLEGRRVETRLLMLHPDGVWAGYSYEWNEEQTDAFLLPASKTRRVGAQTWYYPSRSECLVCHTSAAGRALGPEVGQLNGDLTYPSTGRTRNQLATLEHIGFFAQPLSSLGSTLPRFSKPVGEESLESRARAYLHSNCSGCHRPNGIGGGTADLRYEVPLAEMNVCDVSPQQGDMGIEGARLLAPGAPERSLLSVRMHSLDIHRMPPLGTQVRDTAGLALIDAWIQSLLDCPSVTPP